MMNIWSSELTPVVSGMMLYMLSAKRHYFAGVARGGREGNCPSNRQNREENWGKSATTKKQGKSGKQEEKRNIGKLAPAGG